MFEEFYTIRFSRDVEIYFAERINSDSLVNTQSVYAAQWRHSTERWINRDKNKNPARRIIVGRVVTMPLFLPDDRP